MTVDELEMRTKQEDSLGEEEAFKDSNEKGTRKRKKKSKDSNNDSSGNKE